MAMKAGGTFEVAGGRHSFILRPNASVLPPTFPGRYREMDVINSFMDIFANTSFHQFNSSFNSLGKSEFFQELLREFWETLYTHHQSGTIFLLCLYLPVFLLGFVGNISVLLVVILNRHLRNVTNGLIANLAIADMLGKWNATISW